jgi:hypothetical protein
VGVYIGPLLAGPAFYPPLRMPYYYPPLETAPPVYIEKGPEEAENSWWYFCPASSTYYPYVSECAVEWQRVAPAADGASR